MKSLFSLDYRTSTLLLAWATTYILHLSIACAADPDPNDLIQRLEQTQTSGQAYNDLLAMGDRVIPLAIAGLESPNKDVRRHLALLLGDIKTDKAIAPLVKMTQSKEYSDSSSALHALGKIGGPEAAEAIIAALPRLHPTGQEDFCRILGVIGDNRAIEPLTKLLASRDSDNSKTGGEGIFKVRVRQASAEALGKFRDPRARAALVKAIKDDPHWDVYHEARQAIYRMDSETLYPSYDNLSATVALAVTKEPEPVNGAEEFIRNWHKEHPNYQGAWTGPRLEDYASTVDIERARNAVVERGKTWDPNLQAGGVVELMMEYLCNRKLYVGPENAKALIIRIGKPAIPALENGVKRGDMVLVRNCRQCIEAINMPSNQPQQASKKIGNHDSREKAGKP